MRGVRTLCAASIGYCAAVFLSHYLLSGERLAAVLMLPVIVMLAAVLFCGRMRTRLIIAAVFMAAGFGHYWLHSAQTVDKYGAYVDKELTTTARLTDYPDVRDRCTLLSVKITGEELPNVDALIIDYSNEKYDFVPGDEIRAKLKLRSVTERFGEETDSNISKGVYLSGYTSEKVEKTGHWAGSVLYLPKIIGNALHNEIGRIFPADTAPFMKALLAGYKDDYYQNDKLYASMNVAGLAHVVAVSGMHVAFFVGVLQSILGRNRRSSVICIALVWLFVVMVGSPPSAVRAGIMISIPMLAPVCGRVNDRATTLSFALAVILISNPFSAGSVALQLSFGSVAGMFLFSQPIYKYFNAERTEDAWQAADICHRNAFKLACRHGVYMPAVGGTFRLCNAAGSVDEHPLPVGDILPVRRRICPVHRRPCSTVSGNVACEYTFIPCALYSLCGRIFGEAAGNGALYGK